MTIVATALVVDDEPQMTMIIGYALETQGFTVLSAHDGVSALNILHARDTSPSRFIRARSRFGLRGWSAVTAVLIPVRRRASVRC
jgi:DNA-binding response OmpR family regulator